jgi:hypothetical protein
MKNKECSKYQRRVAASAHPGHNLMHPRIYFGAPIAISISLMESDLYLLPSGHED